MRFNIFLTGEKFLRKKLKNFLIASLLMMRKVSKKCDFFHPFRFSGR